MDIPVPKHEDVERILRPCDHSRTQSVRPCDECLKVRVANAQAQIALAERRHVDAEAAAWKQAVQQIELLAKASAARMQEMTQVLGRFNLASIAASCQHIQPQIGLVCFDCKKTRIDSLRTIMATSIKRYGDEERKPMEPAIRKAEAETGQAVAKNAQLREEITRLNNTIEQLRAMIVIRDTRIKEMEVSQKAERAASSGYIVGSFPRAADE